MTYMLLLVACSALLVLKAASPPCKVAEEEGGAAAGASADKGLAAGTDVSEAEGAAAESSGNEEEEESVGEEEELPLEEVNVLLLASGAGATAEFARRVPRSSSCSRPCQYSWYKVMRSRDMSSSSPVSPPPAQPVLHSAL